MKNILKESGTGNCICKPDTCSPDEVCVVAGTACFCTVPMQKRPLTVNNDNKTGVTATKSIVSGQTQTTLKETVIDRLVSKVIKKLK